MSKKRFLLRIDPRLYDDLQRWASDELRSVNAQMEFLLAEAVHKAGRRRRADRMPSAPSDDDVTAD